jgi:uncharacterized membrane protein
MKNLETSSVKPFLNQKIKLIILFIILASFLGFLEAGYLTAKYYTKTPIVCFVFEGCDKVAASPYATIFNIPLALFGVLFYLAIFFSVLFYWQTENLKAVKLILVLSTFAFLASIYFVYLQFFIIKAICSYCFLSAGFSIILFVLSLMLKSKLLYLRTT